LFEQMYTHHRDRARLIAVARQGREQFEQQMAQERARNGDGLPNRPPTAEDAT
jgi:glutathione-regulated potassium-efflux system ancillary protein KefC